MASKPHQNQSQEQNQGSQEDLGDDVSVSIDFDEDNPYNQVVMDGTLFTPRKSQRPQHSKFPTSTSNLHYGPSVSNTESPAAQIQASRGVYNTVKPGFRDQHNTAMVPSEPTLGEFHDHLPQHNTDNQ